MYTHKPETECCVHCCLHGPQWHICHSNGREHCRFPKRHLELQCRREWVAFLHINQGILLFFMFEQMRIWAAPRQCWVCLILTWPPPVPGHGQIHSRWSGPEKHHIPERKNWQAWRALNPLLCCWQKQHREDITVALELALTPAHNPQPAPTCWSPWWQGSVQGSLSARRPELPGKIYAEKEYTVWKVSQELPAPAASESSPVWAICNDRVGICPLPPTPWLSESPELIRRTSQVCQ